MPLLYPKKLKQGDKIAILSPSGGLPEIFPGVFDQGLERLQTIFGLIPVEYPTTRVLKSSLKDRVKDLHSALQDHQIKGIICSIGGDDQIKLLKLLDPQIIKNNPKFFMGYSDATNLCQYFTQVGGFVTFYGPAIMPQFGVSGAMDEYTIDYLKKAMFSSGEFEILPSQLYSETFLDWSDDLNLSKKRPMFASPEWIWHNFKNQEIEAQTWGGCLEIVDFQLRASRFLPEDSYFENKILYLETSEECPNSDYVYRVLMGMAEKGILQKFSSLIVGRARTLESIKDAYDITKINQYQNDQRQVIIKVLGEYCPFTPVLFNLDFGHSDPIFSIPNGGICRIDSKNQKFFVKY